VLYLTFLTTPNTYKSINLTIHELPLRMAVSLTVLCLGSIFLGYLAKDLFVGIGNAT